LLSLNTYVPEEYLARISIMKVHLAVYYRCLGLEGLAAAFPGRSGECNDGESCRHRSSPERPPAKGARFLPHFRPVILACLLCLGMSAAQQAAPGTSLGSQQSALQQPTSSRDRVAGLNSLQGIPVAAIQIAGPSVEHPEWLEPLVAQKANQPLDKYKVRQSVQALYDTGRFAAIQVEAEQNP